MKERGIIMGPESVRATLNDFKTQTRRVVNPKIVPIVEECFRVNGKWCDYTFAYDLIELSPYGKPRDWLYVKETFATGPENHGWGPVIYKATFGGGLKPVCEGFTPWKSARFMPKVLSRLTLEISSVRAERLQDITEENAIAEGVDAVSMADVPRQATWNRRQDFKQLWDSLNAKRGFGWDANPWVWVIAFRRVLLGECSN